MRALIIVVVGLLLATTAHADVVVGKVVAPDGKPVANATLHVMLWFTDGTGAEQRDVAAKADGSFVVVDSAYHAPVKIVSLVARADGFSSSDDARPKPGTVGAAIALRPAVTETVHVVDDETGAPVTHATITPSDAQHPTPTVGGTGVFANIDDRGRIWLQVAAPGYAPASKWPEFRNGGDEVRLRRRWPLTLHLLDLAGRPIAHCAVTVNTDDTPREDTPQTTDAHGVVHLLVPHGDVSIDPACSHDLHEALSIKHVAGKVDQSLRVPPNQVFTGKVVDAAGKPVAGARVVVRGDEGQQMVTADTDSRGAFRFDSFRDRGFMMDARAGDRSSESISVGPDDTKHPLVLVVH